MKPTTVTFGPVDERILQEIVGRIVEAAHPVRIMVFGSVARGEQGRESDVDLLVVMPDGAHRRLTAQMLYRKLRGVAVPVDLVVTTESDLERHKDNPGLVYRAVLGEGRVLYAVSDLELARMSGGTPQVLLESLCCHAQQCAERALKAVLVHRGTPVPRTHSIGLLLDLLSEQVTIPREVEETTVLTDYAVMCRYPGDVEPVSLQEYERAVHLAETVLAWAKRMMTA